MSEYEAALDRVQEYVSLHRRMLGLDPAVIHNLNGGKDVRGGASLLTADLEVLLAYSPEATPSTRAAAFKQAHGLLRELGYAAPDPDEVLRLAEYLLELR